MAGARIAGYYPGGDFWKGIQIDDQGRLVLAGTIDVGDISVGAVDQGDAGIDPWLVTGPLTDTELRATPVDVAIVSGGSGGGAVTIADGDDETLGAIADAKVTGDNTGTVSAKLRGLNTILADIWDDANNRIKVFVDNTTLAVTQSGTWNINNVSGTVSLPTGAATSAKQDTGNTSLSSIDGKITAVDTGAVVISSSALPTGAATAANQSTGNTSLGTIAGAVSGTEMQVDVITLPALAAGTNAIGKLLPPDVDITTHTNYARKYYTNAGAVTDGIIWSPAAGKRWHVGALYIQVSADATVTLEDDKAGGDDPVWKGELAAKSGVFMVFPEKYPMASGEDAADLLITTSAGNVYVTAVGYEI